MKPRSRIGLLPLYLKLYDDLFPERCSEFDDFLSTICMGFEKRGVEVLQAPVCRLEPEFASAVRRFEDQDVDLIVTLHLAYSPSLESVGVLTATSLPLLVLDTTMDYEFGPDVKADRIMYNHGVHGVQDLASMLRRRKKPFRIVAGHVTESDVLARAAGIAFGASAARAMQGMRALRIGPQFAGMGDFSVEAGVLQRIFSATVDQIDLDVLSASVSEVTEEEVTEEVSSDRERFGGEIDTEVHRRSVRVGLGVRRLLETGGYGAFSANFQVFNSSSVPANVVPFLEASKAMSRGIGYAGEGDVLTAILVGALQRGIGDTTFTEIFCPDWAGNALFLSHMGEINPDIVDGKAQLIEKAYPFSEALNPAVVLGAPRPGLAVLVNLIPGPDDSFSLVAAPVESLGDSDNESLRTSVRGWIRPECELGTFLEQYSLHGGTHHSALVMGERLDAVEAFAEFAGLPCNIVR